METRFPLKDLILYRIYNNKSIIELELFRNFKSELKTLIKDGLIKHKDDGENPLQYPYNLIITNRGIKFLFRSKDN